MGKRFFYRYTLATGDDKILVQPDRGNRYSAYSSKLGELGEFETAEDAAAACLANSVENKVFDDAINEQIGNLEYWDRSLHHTFEMKGSSNG